MIRWIIDLIFIWILFIISAVMGQNCKFYQEMVMGQEYYVYNPGYPKNYPAGSNCFWELRTAQDTKVYLSCPLVNMPITQNCTGDKLSVSQNGRTVNRNYCGKGTFSLLSENTVLTIGLYTTNNSPGGTFYCLATAVKNFDTSTALQTRVTADQCDCGWSRVMRIVGGEETGINQFPSMAALIYQRNFRCGSSIISDRFLLTAAHCVARKNPADFFILVGDHNIDIGTETPASALYKVDAYEVYPSYNEYLSTYDVAIVRTTTAILFSESTGPVCLPFRYTFNSFTGQNVTILGWGSTEFTGPSAEALQKADVSVISNQECNSVLDENITNDEICTFSSEGKDSCQYDSGGPLLWYDRSIRRYQLVGIISHGVGCGTANPSINMRVTEYLQWIVARTSASFCVK